MPSQARRYPLLFEHANGISKRFASTRSTSGFEIRSDRPPPYPYGRTLRYQRANTGLYGGTTIQYGNMVSKQNEEKSRRVWVPNVHSKRLWSESLGEFVKVKLTMRVLKTIDRDGGIDEYLIGNDSPGRIKQLGVAGWNLRWKIMQTEAYRERVKNERQRLGLPVQGWREAEKERIQTEQREAVAAAEVYIEAEEAERRLSALARKERRRNASEADNDVVSDTDQSTIAQAQFANNNLDDVQSQGDVADSRTPPLPLSLYIEADHSRATTTADSGSATKTTAALKVLEAKANLEFQASKVSSSIKSLISAAHNLRDLRASRLAREAVLQEERETLRRDFSSDVDRAFSSDDHVSIVRLYKKHIKVQVDEVNEAREMRAEEPLKTNISIRELEAYDLGTPEGLPTDEWQRLAARAREVQDTLRARKVVEEEQRKAVELEDSPPINAISNQDGREGKRQTKKIVVARGGKPAKGLRKLTPWERVKSRVKDVIWRPEGP